MTWLIVLAALAAGASNPFQSGTNAELNKQLGHSLWALAWVYASALAGILLLQLVVRQPAPHAASVGLVRPWAWLGGLISLAPTLAGLLLAQRLGSGLFTALTLSASLLCSVLLDQFGLVGFTRHAASPTRLAGCAVMILGVWLITRN